MNNNENTWGHAARYCLLSMYITVIAVLGFDIWSLAIWNAGQISFLQFVLMHSLACGIFPLQAAICWWLQYPSWFALLAFPIVLVLGPIGAAGMLMTATIYFRSHESATPFEVWYRGLLPEQMTPPEERIIEHLHIWGQHAEEQHRELVPFTDVLMSGSVEEKQHAIDIMVRNFQPSFAPILRGALNDSSNIIRTHAVAAITRIEEIFLDRTMEMERLTVDFPDDFEHVLALAKHYDDHANAGLSDVDTLDEYRQKAEKLYRKLHELWPEDADILWLLGRLLVRSKRMSEAADTFEQALQISDDYVCPLQRVWYWECLYELRRFEQLRKEIHNHYTQVSNDTDLPEVLLEAVELWMSDNIRFGELAV